MSNDHAPPDALEAFFAQARARPPEPDPALMARILQAGLAQQPRPPRPGQAWAPLAQLLSALGGWRGLGGMATAAAAGLWIGLAGGDRLGALTGLDGAAPEEINLLAEPDVVAFLLDQEG